MFLSFSAVCLCPSGMWHRVTGGNLSTTFRESVVVLTSVVEESMNKVHIYIILSEPCIAIHIREKDQQDVHFS